MKETHKTTLKYLVTVLIGGFFLYLVFRGTDWNDLMIKFRNTNYSWIGLSLAISLISHYFRAHRATLLYETMGYKISPKNSFYAVIVGYMMNYLIPRAGEISRCAALVKTDGMPLNKSLGTVVTERVFDLLILLILLIFIFIFQFDLFRNFISEHLRHAPASDSSGFPVKYMILIGVVLLGFLIYLSRKKLRKLRLFSKLFEIMQGFREGIFSVRAVKKPALFWLLSLSIWGCYILVMYVSFFAMEATSHLTFLNCITVFAIGTIGVVLPAPAAGAGTFHYAVMQSLLLFGVPQEDGIAYATIVHGVQMILVLVLGLYCSVMVMVQQRKKLQ